MSPVAQSVAAQSVAARSVAARSVAAAVGGLVAAGVYAGSRAALQRGRGAHRAHRGQGAQRWQRTNHRGEPVTLLEGPAAAAGLVAAAALAPGLPRPVRLAGVVAAAGAGCLGAYDDLAGSGDARGFRGHLGALRRGEVTTGAVKILGLGATGLLAAGLVREHPLDAVLGGAVVAGTANLTNLLDLRPGRALKAAALVAAPAALRARPGAHAGSGALSAGVLSASVLGVAAALLPDDLGERAMLGDAGANAVGAVLGLAAVTGAGRRGLAARLAVLVALTAASERVSFTRVIEATPGLRDLDRLGRRPVAAPAPRA